tara:strand:- start:673 stop:1056 length:384 start_codon:yes stop_codon:yes gene_type:complete
MPNWADFINFQESEFNCHCCGRGGDKMDEDFLAKLQELRSRVGFACRINSGWRCKSHNVMSGGFKTSAHLTGNAADLGVDRGQAREVIKVAIELGLSVGIAQKGDSRFVHIDNKPRSGGHPALWSYA